MVTRETVTLSTAVAGFDLGGLEELEAIAIEVCQVTRVSPLVRARFDRHGRTVERDAALR
jgi:hypothetical protein